MSYAPRSLSYSDGISQGIMNVAVILEREYLRCKESDAVADGMKLRGMRHALDIIQNSVKELTDEN